jgi:uncharacterized alpha-E superfamily protein
MVAAKAPVVDLVLLDPNNPRSLVFQVERLERHIRDLPGHDPNGLVRGADRIIQRMLSALRLADAHDMDAKRLIALEGELMALSDAVAERFFTPRRVRATRTA